MKPKLSLTLSLLGASWLLAACGGGEVSGTVSGLSADGLTLSNGHESLAVAKDATSFAFPTDLAEGKSYAVVVLTQPTGLRCSVANGTGTASAAAGTAAVSVTCIPVWSISGTVTRLLRTGLVLNNGFEDIAVAAGAASFAFPTQLASGSSYLVTIKVQPLLQVCTVDNNVGQVDAAPVTNVALTCI